MHGIIYNPLISLLRKLKPDGKSVESLNLSIPILIGIFIFFNPFPHTTTIKEICFYLSAFVALLLFVFKKADFSFKTPLSIPFALFVLWAFLGLFFALNKENSLHDFRAHLLEYLALYYLLVNFFNSRGRFSFLTWVIIMSAAVFSIGAMTYFYFILGNPISTRLSFLEMHMNYIGFVTLFAIFLSLHHFSRELNLYHRLILLVCLLATVMATLLTQSRGTIIAAVFASIVLFTKNKKSLIVFLLLFLIGLGITPGLMGRFAPAQILRDPRIGIHFTTYEIIKAYPIFGIGFGMQTYDNIDFLRKYNAKIPAKYSQETPIGAPHNLLFDVAVRTGIGGLTLFLYILYIFVQMSWKIIRYGKDGFIRDWGPYLMAAFVAFFIQAIFEDASFGLQAIVLYTILAMMAILWRLNIELDNQPDSKSAHS